MENRNILIVAVVAICVCAGGMIAAGLQSSQQPPKVKRVKRPTFTKKDWENVFFEDLFEQGLVGPRPERLDAGPNPRVVPDSIGSGIPAENNNATTDGFAWSDFISRDAIENEVKTLQSQLAQDITTPGKFKSEYGKVRQSFSMLSMLFGLIREYDDEVRWKEDAGAAQASFARAAANARVGSAQAYQSAKRRKDELQEMVRGGAFNGEEKAPESLEWPLVVDRSPIMERLKAAADLIKPSLSSKTEFVGNIEAVLQEAELIAVMSQILIREDMEEYDEDEYIEFAKGMSTAARNLVAAAKTKNYESASPAFNLIQQACANCHGIYQ